MDGVKLHEAAYMAKCGQMANKPKPIRRRRGVEHFSPVVNLIRECASVRVRVRVRVPELKPETLTRH